VTRRDAVDVTWLDVDFAAVLVRDVQAAGNDVADVFDLAAFRSDDRLDALGPPPGRNV